MRTQSHTSWIFAQVDFLSGLLRTRFEASWQGLTVLSEGAVKNTSAAFNTRSQADVNLSQFETKERLESTVLSKEL